MRLAAAAMALSLAWTPASAMGYSYRLDNGLLIINATGDIDQEDYFAFFNFIATLPVNLFNMIEANDGTHVMVVFNSVGGRVGSAFRMAHLIVGNRMMTSVAPHGQCASACVIAWAAGVKKFVPNDARIAVHSASDDGTAGDLATQEKLSAKMTGVMANWFRETGAPENVVRKTLKTPSKDLYWLTAADLAAWETTR